jgi:hypothetical protein
MPSNPEGQSRNLQDVLTDTRLMLGKAQDDCTRWKALADAKAEEVKALREELASLQENYHLLNAAVARVLTGDKKGAKR